MQTTAFPLPRSSAAGRPRATVVVPAPRASRRWVSWLLPSFTDLIYVACLIVAFMQGSLMMSTDGDPARHLAMGNLILNTHAIPRVDVFSYTMGGQPFVPYEWLSEVLSALSFRLAGAAGPVLLHGALIALTFALILAHLRRRGLPLLLAVGVSVAVMAASYVHWLARPHVFSFLGTALVSILLDGWFHRCCSARRLWLLPPLMVVWANAHGGFLIGLVLLAIYGGSDLLRWLAGSPQTARPALRRLRELSLPAGAAFLACAINPAGFGLFHHVTGYLGKKLLVDITQEYKSPDFHQTSLLVFLYVLLLIVAALMWSKRRPALHEGFILLAFTYFSLYSARNIPLFAIVAAPILAAQLAGVANPLATGRFAAVGRAIAAWVAKRNAVYERVDRTTRAHVLPLVVTAALLAVGAAQARGGAQPLGISFSSFHQPVGAARYLQAHLPEGEGFNELAWGGYLIHELWPEKRVFIDGQTDFYGEPLTREYLKVVKLDAGWQQVLETHQVQWVIYPTDSALVRTLSTSAGWHAVYGDDLATVLVRTKGEDRA